MRATVVAHHLRRREFGLAQLHALRLEDAQTQAFAMETCAAEWAFSADTKEEERDLIVARAVLEVLARGSEAAANRVWMECEKRRGKNAEPSPLLNCVVCLMEIV